MSAGVDTAVVLGVDVAGLLAAALTSANGPLTPMTCQISIGGLS